MKKILIAACSVMCMLFCIRGQSQSIAPDILNASGGTYDNPSSYLRLEWSIGELVLVDTYVSVGKDVALTNGLLQPCTEKGIRDQEILLFGAIEYKIFPNVTKGLFEVDFFLNLPGQMELQLTDALGRVLETRKYRYKCCSSIERFNISNQPKGVYFINARFTPEHPENPRYAPIRRQGTFQIVKG